MLNTNSSAPKKFTAKGHDAQLQDAQFGNKVVTLRLMNCEDAIVGKLVRRDKFTITIRDNADGDTIYYKHAIESIKIGK